jgi:hypothetical protein
MTAFEVSAVLHHYGSMYKDGWNKTRLICFYCAAPFSKDLKLKDILQFEWDVEEEKQEEKQEAISIEEKEEMLKRQKEMVEYIEKTHKDKPLLSS